MFAGGGLEGLRLAWQGGRITPLLSSDTAEEPITALAYPRIRPSPTDGEELLADYVPIWTMISSAADWNANQRPGSDSLDATSIP